LIVIFQNMQIQLQFSNNCSKPAATNNFVKNNTFVLQHNVTTEEWGMKQKKGQYLHSFSENHHNVFLLP